MSAPRVRELTPRGRGGVAVLALEGPRALERVRELCADSGRRLSPGAAPRLVRLRAEGGEALDEALVLAFSEEAVELHLHASPPLVQRVLELFGGALPPPAGSLEQRAAALLATAPSEAAARILLDQSEGALRRELEALRSLDPAALVARVQVLLERARVARYALEVSRVLLAGPVNAGKSTLFNALFGAGRVVTSASAGTTRDVIVERARLGPWPIELIDAPGERGRVGAAPEVLALEREGLGLARELVAGADLVLWLWPADSAPRAVPAELEAAPVVVLTSLADRLSGAERVAREPAVSALVDPAGAARRVQQLFVERLGLPARAWSAGEATPFEPGQVARLEALGAARDAAARARMFDELLAPPTAAGVLPGPESRHAH